jgi:hypothetical protein
MDNLWVAGSTVYSSDYLNKYVIEKVTPKGGIRVNSFSDRRFKVYGDGISAYHRFAGDWQGVQIFADTIEARAMYVEARAEKTAMSFLCNEAVRILALQGNDAVAEANRIKAMRGEDVK